MNYKYLIKIIAFLIFTIDVNNKPIINVDTDTLLESGYFVTITDLPKITERKGLIALTGNSSTGYFIYKGEPMGYDYEMLNAFAKYLNVNLKIIVAKNMNDVLNVLRRGEVDIVSANLTVSEDRMKKVDFTEPFLYTRQVLVQKKPKGWREMNTEKLDHALIRSTIEMSGKRIYVRKKSSYYSRLKNLNDESALKIHIVEMPGDVSTEDLISMVAQGKIPYTIADENIAMVNQTYYPNIDVKTAISFPQKIAWAVNKKSPLLLAALNKWISTNRNKEHYVYLYNKYYKNPKGSGIWNSSEFSSNGGDKISIYDDIIIKYSSVIGWDWRLLASMICQESRFDPEAQSWTGACGLMQILPSTAIRFDLDTCSPSPEASIYAGVRYLKQLDKYWSMYISNENERIKFVLASYNVGLGHIIDARNLAAKYHKNKNVWHNNVEQYILLISKPGYYNDSVVRYGYCRGEEPYNYVKEIMSRYEHYKNIIHPADTIKQHPQA